MPVVLSELWHYNKAAEEIAPDRSSKRANVKVAKKRDASPSTSFVLLRDGSGLTQIVLLQHHRTIITATKAYAEVRSSSSGCSGWTVIQQMAPITASTAENENEVVQP
jgi:aspartyl/asparaginyl-tRNA synthetase